MHATRWAAALVAATAVWGTVRYGPAAVDMVVETPGLRDSRDAVRRAAERNLSRLRSRYGEHPPDQSWPAYDVEAYWGAKKALRD